jgi:peptidoglycan/xylan/chitin deacetylase (PgdA/CDA1 family)
MMATMFSARTVACTGAAVTVAHAFPAAVQPLPALGPLLGVEVRTRERRGVGLTFDDGPHPQATPRVLEVLAAHAATATFFLVGEQVARHPGLARDIVAAGHRLGLHGDRHRNLLRLTPAQTRDDLLRGQDRIACATGVGPTIFRPPYGVMSAAAVWIARRHRWRTLLWTHWGRDWERRATPRSVFTASTQGLREGSVVLLHDADHYAAPLSWHATLGALPAILDRLAGLELAAVAA